MCAKPIDADILKRQVVFPQYVEARLGKPNMRGYRYWIWRSPFRSDDDTPSFVVYFNNGNGIACDFGTGETYDIFSFVQRLDNVSFVEALQSVNQWVNGGSYRVVTPYYLPKQPERKFAQITWDTVMEYRLKYPQVKTYIELKRRILPNVATTAKIGAVVFDKHIEYRGKHAVIPVRRAVLPYYFGDDLHGTVSRRDDVTFMERLNYEFPSIFAETHHRIVLTRRAKDPSYDFKAVTDKDVLDEIHRGMWTPEKYRKYPDSIALLRWHQVGRRSIYNASPYCFIENGAYRWKTPIVVIHESETDALACASVCDGERVANIAYKYTNDINIPFWRVFGKEPVLIYVAVQNDNASRTFAKHLVERLQYSKENNGISRYFVDYLYTPEGYKDFSEMHENEKLKDYLSVKLVETAF